MIDPGFWQNRRVFITGHTGFKGSWASLWLSHLGAKLTGYSLPPPTSPSLFEQAQVMRHMTSQEGDVRDLAKLERAVRDARPEVVFHMAAQALVRESYADPVGTYATNVMGTAHLLEAVRRAGGVLAVVIVTSDKCYENRDWAWPYRENDRLGGRDPYSSSKGCAELVTAAYAQSYFSGEEDAGVATGRAGNVIGGGDWAKDRIVPDCVRAFQKGEPVTVRNPAAIRPWQHVLEPLAGYFELARRLATESRRWAGAWNFGPSEPDGRSVADVVEALARSWGSIGWQRDDRVQSHEARLLRLDATKARTLLGWRPRLDLDRALEWTARWYKEVEKGNDAFTTTLRDIESFSSLPP